MKKNPLSEVKKSKASKDKRIEIVKADRCVYLLYYDKDEVKKSKIFLYPIHGTNSEISKVDKMVNKEYKLWKNCLWHYGYLEDDDRQLIEFKMLDKKKKS